MADPKPFVRLAAFAAVALTMAFPAQAERTIRSTTVIRDSGQRVERVTIDSRGVVVTRENEDGSGIGTDSAMTFHADIDLGDADYRGAGIVRLFSDARVNAGDAIDGDVVAVFGDVHVDGSVNGSAVAVFGSVSLAPEAKVMQDAVAVGGQLVTPAGSQIGGESVSIGFLPLLTLGLPALPVVLATLLLGWLVTLFFGWVMAAIFPERLVRVARTASRRTGVSLGLGILSGPLAVVAAVLLLVTVVGAPIAVLMPFLYFGLTFAGYLAAVYVLGCKITRRRIGEGGAVAPIAWGSLLVIVFGVIGALLWSGEGSMRTLSLFFHLAGLMLFIGLMTIGTGAALLSRLGSPERPAAPEAPTATAPAAGPPGEGAAATS